MPQNLIVFTERVLLEEQIKTKVLINADLSRLDVSGLNFSDCTLSNVIFSSENNAHKKIVDVSFCNATLHNVFFENCNLSFCNFDQTTRKSDEYSIEKCSFKKSTLTNCRFRKACISWSDFRYSEINNGTFEDARIDFCDFYRSNFLGVIIFRKSVISNSSLYYAYFNEGANIRRSNLLNDTIIQQDKAKYRKFLADWETHGPSIRKNDQQQVSQWNIDTACKARFADAEDIYKNLNGLWMSKGFYSDANWAYVQGRRMELRRHIAEFGKQQLKNKIIHSWKIVTNLFSNILFGYGESMFRMVLTYILVIMIFAFLYNGNVSFPTWLDSIWVSLKKMVGVGSESIEGVSPFVDILNILQTTVGVLLTGIFGFILGNKIRNQ
ncbi:MAG: pentapeptide repeat-containing protein [Proteiniphilum sp.]|nr:pentapeptide repeat-containing protein [Proteiniphilum sp.]MDD3908480.1 pentapeptide repeat-containing protein [Proteiniphilum sp.]MDD4415969.1 pentapeptide repeat-containing protein [Proteiniphilum sp.]